MSKIAVALLASLLALPASAWQYAPGRPPSSGPNWGLGSPPSDYKREKPPEFRNLTGVVLDKSDSPLKDAVVHLKNRKTKKETTYIADAEGAYRFPSLSRTADYEVYAELKGQKSPIKALSSLDSRTNAKINLHIELKKEEEKDAAKSAEKAPPDPAEKGKEKDKDKAKVDDRVHLPDLPK